MDKDETYRKAEKKVEAKLYFYKNLVTYIIVNIILFIINYATSGTISWALFVLFGWGIGIVFHGAKVFLHADNFKEKMIRKELEKSGHLNKDEE